MSDYDIVIKLDPGQPVAGAKQVTAAVAQVEVVGEKAKKAVDGVAEAAKSLKSINFKQAAAAGAQAWGILAQKTELMNTALGKTIDSGVKFAALGAQVAGPWGAAIGATVGLADGLNNALGIGITKAGKLGEELDRLADKQKRAGLAVGDATKAVEAAGKSLADYAQYASTVNRVTHSMAEGFKGLANAASSVPDWLMRVGLGYDPWDPGATKKKLDKINAAPKGGGERQYFNGLSPLDYYSGSAPKPYMGLGERADGGSGPYAVDVADQMALAQIAADNLKMKIAATADETLRLAASTRAWKQELAAADSVLLSALEGVKQMSNSFVDTLVEGAFGADVSWKKWGEDMLKMFAKLILQASLLRATGSPTGGVGGTATGLYKLLGFASGGVIGPRGGGAADTETAMFRVAPRETIRIHTPEQEAAYRNGAGGGATVNIVNTPVDDRALLQALSGPAGAQTVLNTVRANRRAIKALLDD